MSIQQILGFGFLALGLVSMSSYTDAVPGFKISWFYQELRPMQERWGKTTGTILHFVEYVLAPLGFGFLFLMGMVNFH